jgi:adenylate cyclase
MDWTRRLTLPAITRRDLRLASGLVLFTYIALHLANHALGLVSIAFAERGLRVATEVWQSLPGSLLLYGSAGVHVVLALLSIFERRTLRMPPLEMLRIVLGLGIPTLLIGHAVATRIAWDLYRVSSDYHRVVWRLWMSNGQGRQLALLVPG